MVWMYLVSLFGFSFAILSMAEMSSMYVVMGNLHDGTDVTDSSQGSYLRRTISVSDQLYQAMKCLRTTQGWFMVDAARLHATGVPRHH